jgi:hypothetical protein
MQAVTKEAWRASLPAVEAISTAEVWRVRNSASIVSGRDYSKGRGKAICEHGSWKQGQGLMADVDICEHSKHKQSCKECGEGICVHGKHMRTLQDTAAHIL